MKFIVYKLMENGIFIDLVLADLANEKMKNG